MNEKSSNNDLLGISLIIDENNITHINIDSKKVDNLNYLVGKVCKKYNLDNKTKEKLGKEINKRIDDLVRNKKCEIKKKKENTINRLYYESIEKIKEKNAFLEGVRKEKEEEVLNTFPFSPTINKNSNLLYEKTYLRIEDKLYNEFKVLKEKQNFTRLITEISSRSKSRNKNNSKYSEQKNKTLNGLKQINITKSSKLLNNKENKENISDGNFLILKKLSTNSKEKENKNMCKNNAEKYLNIDEVSYINKNKTFNTEDSIEDSYLNLKALPNKLEEKSHNLERIDDKREFEMKNTIINIGNKKTSTNNIIEINNKSPRKQNSKAVGDNSNLNIHNNELLAKTPAFFKNFDAVLESTSRILKKRNTLAYNNPDVFLAELSKRFSFNTNNTNFEKNSYTKRYRTLTIKPNLNVQPTTITNTNYLKSKTHFSLNQNQNTNNLNNINLNYHSNNANNLSVNQFHLNSNDSANPIIDTYSNETQVNQYMNTMPNAASKNLNQESTANFSPNAFEFKEKIKISKNSNKRKNFQNNFLNIKLNNNVSKEKENLNNYNSVENHQYISDDKNIFNKKINNSNNILNLAQITSFQNNVGSFDGSNNYNNFSNVKKSGKESELYFHNNFNKILETEKKNNSPQNNTIRKKNSSKKTTTVLKKSNFI